MTELRAHCLLFALAGLIAAAPPPAGADTPNPTATQGTQGPTEAETLAWLHTHLPQFVQVNPPAGNGAISRLDLEGDTLVIVINYDTTTDDGPDLFSGICYPQAKLTINLRALTGIKTAEIREKKKRVCTAVSFSSEKRRPAIALANSRLELGKFANEEAPRAILDDANPLDAGTAAMLSGLDANGVRSWLDKRQKPGTPEPQYDFLFADVEWATRFSHAITHLVELHGGFVPPIPKDDLFK